MDPMQTGGVSTGTSEGKNSSWIWIVIALAALAGIGYWLYSNQYAPTFNEGVVEEESAADELGAIEASLESSADFSGSDEDLSNLEKELGQ